MLPQFRNRTGSKLNKIIEIFHIHQARTVIVESEDCTEEAMSAEIVEEGEEQSRLIRSVEVDKISSAFR